MDILINETHQHVSVIIRHLTVVLYAV